VDFGIGLLYIDLYLDQRGRLGQVLHRTLKCPIAYRLVSWPETREVPFGEGINIDIECR
jgi:hypothetical protein